MQRLAYFFLITTLLLGNEVQAQPRAGATFVPVAPEILSNTFVRCFYRDSKGYMWLGTAEGLMRYDGTNIVRYEHDPADHSTIPHNLINAIAEDSEKTLWIGTAQGLLKFNRELDNFINVDSIAGTVNHLNSRFITALTFDQQGHVWIGTHGKGINVYDPKALVFRYLSVEAEQRGVKSSEFVTNLLYHDDLIWCATKRGLELYNASDKMRIPFTCLGPGIPEGEISQLARDNAGNIWLARNSGDIVKLIEGNGYYTCKTMISGKKEFGAGWDGIRTIAADAKGNFWIGGENAGLNYLNTSTGEVTHFNTGNDEWGKLPTNSILSVFVDHTGLTWIGTMNQGAFLIDDNSGKFNQYSAASLLTGKIIRGIAEDLDGNIWLGLEGTGLAKLDVNTGELRIQDHINKQLANKFLTTLICDRSGNLWIGTSGSGAYRLNPGQNQLRQYNVSSNGLGDNKLYCLYEDKKGKIWAGSAGSGLFYLDADQNKFVLFTEPDKPRHLAGTTYVTSIQEDAQGVFWVGTLYGLYSITRLEDGSNEYDWYGLTDDGRLSGNAIQTVFEDRRRNLWVATNDNGFNVRWKGEKDFRIYKRNDGLVSNTVRSLVSDSRGNVWIGTNMGLSKFDITTKAFTNYSRYDGLASNSFTENTVLRSTSGSLFFGTNNGFNSFYPDSLVTDHTRPVVVLSDLKIGNQSAKIGEEGSPLTRHISLTSEIELDHTQRSFTVSFAAINYTHGLRINYCYMLKGFDKDWNCLPSNHAAYYTNIDPGEYTFLVRASNGDGLWSEPTELRITIHPAPWSTWWAILSYCIVAGVIAYFLLRFRMDRIRMQTQLRLERVAHERERELIESKTQFFTNVSHEFRTPLSLILLPLETLMTSNQIPASIKNKIATAHSSAEKMMNLVNELMDFNKVESGTMKLKLSNGDIVLFVREVTSSFYDLAERRNIHFSVVSEITSIKGHYDPAKLEKIVFNLLSNAFKFTNDGGQIQVVIREKTMMNERSQPRRCVELIILDNGIGIDASELPLIFDKFYQAKSASKVANPGTGIGLSLTKALIELHGGTITAESVNMETKFTVILPIEKLGEPEVLTEAMGTSAAISQAVQPAAEQPKNEKAQILLVEDNAELRKHLADELRAEYTVFECTNGADGVATALEKIPDLIISDILMASQNGLELCKTLKSDVKTSHIPIILLTAKATVEEQIIGIEAGADLYITKPFNYRFLLTHVRNIVSSREKLYAHFSKDVYLLPAKAATNAIDQAFLQRFIDHIVAHMQDPQLSVDSIAEVFNLSRVQVYRKIKALTGKSAVELIRSVRLKEALKLMETKKYTLAEISYQIGFSSPSYFTRSFKEEYGKAPSEFLQVN